MALKEYRAKRDFTRSPEPAGSDETASSRSERTRFFCVQKHLASQLHYDFRLEHNGVLLSWAVPKGPSLDPSIKRLAMHVEDHPIEYGTFEGVIPEGYGAGVVMLWDQGTWTPESDDVDASLAKGDLKFTLEGYKLKGSWVLVRTRGWGASKKPGGGGESGKSSWLLIKHRDDWAGPIDIAAFAPLSVKSGGTFREILTQEAPDLWHSNRAAEGMTGDAALVKIVEKVLALEEEEGPGASEPGSGKGAGEDSADAAADETPGVRKKPAGAKAKAEAKTPAKRAASKTAKPEKAAKTTRTTKAATAARPAGGKRGISRT